MLIQHHLLIDPEYLWEELRIGMARLVVPATPHRSDQGIKSQYSPRG